MDDTRSEVTSDLVRNLMSSDFIGTNVVGLPSSWQGSYPPRSELFHLYVGLPLSNSRQVWEMVVEWPDAPYLGTGLRFRCLAPGEPSAEWVYGWVGLDVVGAVVCDHTVRPHGARVLALDGEGLTAMPELVAALDEETDDLAVADVSTYFGSTLAPLAIAIVKTFTKPGAEEPIRVPPFSLLPPGPEWEPPDWNAADWPKPPFPEASVVGLPVMQGTPDEALALWTTYDVEVTRIVEDHGWFSAAGDSGRPGGDWVFIGWATWADGTLLAVSRWDYYDNEPPVVNRIALPGYERAEPERPEWWLALMRGLPLASSWVPKEW